MECITGNPEGTQRSRKEIIEATMTMQAAASQAKYSKEERVQALAVLAACGGNACEAARRTGLPRRTLARWAAQAIDPEARSAALAVARKAASVREVASTVAAVEVAKLGLAARFEDLASRCLEETARPERLQGASLRDLTWSAAVSVDKMRLLREQPPPPTQAEQKMADAVARAAEVLVELAAQSERTIALMA